MSLEELQNKIEQRQATLGVIGLGYVGLPVACLFAQVGFRVVGLEIRCRRVEAINAGDCPIEGDEPGMCDLLTEVVKAGRLVATDEYTALSEADVALIAVETPVDQDHKPEYSALQAACRGLGAVIKRGALVVVESTVAPGTTRNIVRPLLEQASGYRAGVDFFLGICPERVMPGKLLANLRTVSRICGSDMPETAQVMVALYRQIVQAELDTSDVVTAEVVKTTENTYRDVQIAFANEVALICEVTGADVWRVRELVNKTPLRQMHLPGAGVGGHCIPKDPWLLAHAARDQVQLQIIPSARAVNDGMPLHVADLTAQTLQSAGRPIAGAHVAILGYTYLENSDDTRNSPSRALVKRLRELGADVVIHDPYVAEYKGDVLECIKGCDAVVVMVAHRTFKELDLAAIKAVLRTPVLIDGRRVFDAAQARKAGLVFRGVGQG